MSGCPTCGDSPCPDCSVDVEDVTAYCINCAQPLTEVRQVTTGVCPTHGVAHAGTFVDTRPPDPWPVIDKEGTPQ